MILFPKLFLAAFVPDLYFIDLTYLLRFLGNDFSEFSNSPIFLSFEKKNGGTCVVRVERKPFLILKNIIMISK